MRVRVKICGLTRLEDGRAAVDAGVLGFAFHPRSPRHLGLTQAECLIAAVPPLVSVVVLFAEAGTGTVRTSCAALPLDQLQFYGFKTAAYCRQFGRHWYKAVPMRGLGDAQVVADWLTVYPGSSFLYNASGKSRSGGGSVAFDWCELPAHPVPHPCRHPEPRQHRRRHPCLPSFCCGRIQRHGKRALHKVLC